MSQCPLSLKSSWLHSLNLRQNFRILSHSMGNSYAISSSQRSYQKNILSKSTLRVVWLLLAGSFVILACRPDSQKSKCIAFGGEDQKFAMASKPGKDVTVEVKTSGAKRNTASRSKSRGRNRNVKITVNSQPRNNRRRRNRPNNRGRKRVEAVVKQQLDKAGVTGPKAAITQTATATLGTIGPNTSGAVELELANFLNPCLVKESTAANSFGPIQASAAQYGLWKIARAEIRLTPMVGPSAISGTAYRISLNTSGQPSSTGWSGLGARKHKDARVGATSRFVVTSRDTAGPREGWFVTNTNESGGESVGPTIELHSLGETKSTYTNTSYSGPVFLVELRATWMFANFAANPALALLEKGEDAEAQIKFEGQPGQPLTMTLNPESAVARTLERKSTLAYSRGRAPEDSTSETIWQIAATAVDATTAVVPPPFGWLIRGGWWFVKKLAGRTRAGEVQVQVYASYEDAQNDRPAICTSASSTTTATRHHVKFVQMNAPSTGIGGNNAEAYIIDNPTCPEPLPPTGDFHATMALNEVITGGQQGVSLPYYLEKADFKIRVKLGDVYDEVNFVSRVSQPYIFFKNQLLHSTPTPMPMCELQTFSTTTPATKGEILGFSQQFVTRDSKVNIVTNYLVKLTSGINVPSMTATPYSMNYTTQNPRLLTLAPHTAASVQTSVVLAPGTWFLFTAIHRHDQGSGLFTMNGTKPTVFASPNAAALVNFGASSSQSSPLFFTANFSRGSTLAAETVFSMPAPDYLPTPLEHDFLLTDNEITDDDEDDSLLEDDDFFPATDEQVFSSRQTLYNTMVNEGWPEDQAERLVKRALPTRLEKELRDEFLVGLADGFSPRQAAANAREKCSRGHAE
nr:MAG: capsid protein [Canine astrovirus]